MYCFRIEDSSGIKGKYRVYRSNYQELPNISSDEVDKYIAEEVREAVNGSPSRTALCYSKSLAVCLLKYNKQNLSSDNKLHVCKYKRKNCNCVFFRKLKNNDNPDIRRKLKRKKYYIDSNDELYIKCKNIKLCNYILELNNNAELNKYLKKHSPNGKGLKSRASPQKDEEILIMQIDNVVIDRVIEEEKVWIAYLLLGLQLGFGVLSDNEVLFQIKNEIDD